jgi:hypothetical protein
MIRWGATWAAAALALTSLTAAALAQPSGGSVKLDLASQNRLGVKSAALKAEKRKGEVDAFAKVLDPGPLVALDTDLATAIAAAAASRAEAVRSKALNAAAGVVSAKDAEAAESQARQDAIKTAFLRRRLGLEWGPGLARLSDPKREALIRALVSGKAALVHVDTPSNEGQAGARTVKVDVGADSVAGVVLGAARAAEPRLQSSGLIVEVDGPSAILLSVGLTQSAHIDSGDAKSGVVVPRSAVIRYQGSDWAYVRRAGTRFDRRLLVTSVPEEAGLFVTDGFSPGDEVVTDGVAGLFTAELGQASARAK